VGRASGREADYNRLPRGYRRQRELSREQRVELFVDRLRDYGCGVHGCRPDEIAPRIAEIVRERKKTRLLATSDIAPEWLPNEVAFIRNADLTYRELDAMDGVVTRCALAIAATGTIVLRHDASAGRRTLTLIPDYHLCILFEEQIVELVPEGLRAMAAFAPAPLTTISGPSATSDIEMMRIQGVHGPRTLDVVLVR
jgi:L-lactate dehydrogenase complex protein LldG